ATIEIGEGSAHYAFTRFHEQGVVVGLGLHDARIERHAALAAMELDRRQSPPPIRPDMGSVVRTEFVPIVCRHQRRIGRQRRSVRRSSYHPVALARKLAYNSRYIDAYAARTADAPTSG